MRFATTLRIAALDAFAVRATAGGGPAMALGTMATRPALLVRATDAHGCEGWGEVWANFPPRANVHKAHVLEDVVAPRLRGFAFADPQEATAFLRHALSTYFLHVGQERVFEHILAGIDVALWDLALRSAGRSFAAFAGLREASARSYASSVNAPDLQELLPRHAGWGQAAFKLKLGIAGTSDRDVVERAAALCPTGTRLMVDSNQSWSVPTAVSTLRSIEEFDPLFAEEPIAADSPAVDWSRLARSTSIPLAGGENLYGIDAFVRMVDAGLRYVQPDVAKWGGVSGALALADALPHGVALWPHFMGTAVGQMAALSVAALDEVRCCEVDVNANPLRTHLCGDVMGIDGGRIALASEPGLVVPPDPECLARFGDPPHVAQPPRRGDRLAHADPAAARQLR